MSQLQEHRTNSLLGYPDDARLLIINADDFGMCHSNNEATFRALTEGIVTSTTLMAPCPWAPHAMALLRENATLPFGVHLTLVSEASTYRWRPIAGRSEVPSLVDEAGYFFSADRIPELLANARLDEVEIEFRAQIDAVLNAQLKPTHLDWHCLLEGGRADIFDLSLRLAREHGLAVRVSDESEATRLQEMGLPVNSHRVVDSYRLETEGKQGLYAGMLRELPAGLSEWAVHPSLGNAESQAMEPDSWGVRKADFDFVMSSEARDLLNAEGIILLDYRALQAVWSEVNVSP